MTRISLLIFITIITFSGLLFAQASDASLKVVIEKDRSSRTADGRLMTLSAAEHLARGTVYFDNRSFPAAREHFQKIVDNYPNDPAISSALFMIGRSFYWERNYKSCIPILSRVANEFPGTKDGREGLYFQASCNVRLGKNSEAAPLFERYVTMYPTGERIDGAYLNAIDTLRESGRYDTANEWVERTRTKFKGQPTETNALHARLRMQIYRSMWADAVATAALMEGQAKFPGSITTLDEVRYLRALALEKQGLKADAISIYAALADKQASYFGYLAGDRISKDRSRIKPTARVRASDYPVMFREEVLQYARKKKLDPRFLLAVMKQESTFRPGVKSPSAARGLLQLVMDTALKYSKKAGYGTIQPDDLYDPRINIAIGAEYIADLKAEFGGMYEAIAASYNGGEDNAARWLARSRPKDPAIFTSEVGFPETKNYVQRVMTNYFNYQRLYDENLSAKR
ncbi:MAG: transglycosylase SLT domain-containing protein [Acidobacteria bacterium]|nr:transglycosylase SLT domain-containing protein [Acidobacteriota bacterium]